MLICKGLTISIIEFSCLIYSFRYMEEYIRRYRLPFKKLNEYYSLFTVTFLTLYMMSISNNIFILWVFVEATTLSTALLVSFGSYEAALEGAWKYIILCTIGLSLALYSSTLIYSYILDITGNPYKGLLFTDIAKYVSKIDLHILSLTCIMVIIGYGVKAGLFPMHWWVPDAYSEAPSPISAILSSVIESCGFYAIIRWLITVYKDILYLATVRNILLILGMVSIFLGSLFMIKQYDLKRILAYSSIENMGIIALLLSYPVYGFLYAIMHLFNHSILKASTFLAVGNIEYKYGRRSELHGIISDSPILGYMLLIGIIALEGSPPFSSFYSIFNSSLAIRDLAVLVIYLIGIFIGFIAITNRFIEVSWGVKMNTITRGNTPILMVIMPFALIAISLILGLYPSLLFNICSKCVGGG